MTTLAQETLTRSHKVATRVEWKRWWDPDSAYQEIGHNDPTIVVVDGSVTLNRWSSTRRTGSLTLRGWGSMPADDWSGVVSPLNRYRLWRGVEFGDGTEYLWCLGTFMVTDLEPERATEGPTVSLALADEFKMVDLDELPAPINLASTVTVKQALRWLLVNTVGWPTSSASYVELDEDGEIITTTPTPTFTDPRTGLPTKDAPNWVTTGPLAVEDDTITVGGTTTLDGSRTSAVQTLTEAGNVTCYLNEFGVLEVTRRAATIDNLAWSEQDIIDGGRVAWTFVGGDGGTLVDIGPGWSVDDIVNETLITSGDVAVRRSVTSGPVAAANLGVTLRYAEDASDKPVGATVTALRAYGRRVAKERLGASRQVSFVSLVLPFLKPDDIVQVATFDGQAESGLEMMIVDELTIPLRSDTATMGVSCRMLDQDNFPA